MLNKNKIVVGMSGGIDSCITALLLKEAGYEIEGVTLRIWDYLSEGYEAKDDGCCSSAAVEEARAFAEKIGVPHHVVDVQNDFKRIVAQNFIDEYIAARTPNPCVMCNPTVKWAAMLAKADELGAYYIATGHYSQIAENNGRYYIHRAADNTKDQSYVLWRLSQEQLSRTMLPLGKYLKSEIKTMAAERGFNQLVQKRESQEICFIPDNDYRKFLRTRLPNLESEVDNGNFVNANGKILGKHHGYPFYTIGQRKGLNIALGTPAYVTKIDKQKNEITLGSKDELLATSMIVKNYNGIKLPQLSANNDFMVKIRYNSQAVSCHIDEVGDEIKVTFNEPVSAITPGQSAVFYDGNDLIGGAFIVR